MIRELFFKTTNISNLLECNKSILTWEIEGLGTRPRHLEVELLVLATKEKMSLPVLQ